MARNQTVQVGENALIHCAVKQSGEKSVRSGGDVEDTCFEQKERMGEHERDEVFWEMEIGRDLILEINMDRDG